MTFRFVYHRISTGGIEHYILNLSQELIRRNHNIELELITHNGHDLVMLERIQSCGVTIIQSGSRLHMLVKACYLNKKIEPNVKLISFDWQSFIWVSVVYGRCQYNHITGIYHIDEWNFDRWPLAHRLAKSILLKLPYENVITGNEYNQEIYSERMSGVPPFVPVGVPIPLSKNNRIHPGKSALNIVLVGRIEGWKSFLYQSINYLKSADFDFKLHVVGDGRDSKAYKKYVSKYISLQNVEFYGNVDMTTLIDILLKVDLAISVGTSALLTASVGVPTIIGKENSLKSVDVNYGWFSNIRGYTYQEENANLSEFTYSLISDFILLNNEEFRHLKNEHIRAANKWDIKVTCESFLNAACSSKTYSISRVYSLAFIVLFFLNRLTKKSNQYWTRRLGRA